MSIFFLHVFLSSKARCFWICVKYFLKIQEGEEKSKDHSGEIWLILIWKYCLTSAEPNYLSELVVLSEPAHSHYSTDGQGVVRKSVTEHGVHMNPWFFNSPPFMQQIRSTSLLLLDPILYPQTVSQEKPDIFFTPSSSATFVLFVCIEKMRGEQKSEK